MCVNERKKEKERKKEGKKGERETDRAYSYILWALTSMT